MTTDRQGGILRSATVRLGWPGAWEQGAGAVVARGERGKRGGTRSSLSNVSASRLVVASKHSTATQFASAFLRCAILCFVRLHLRSSFRRLSRSSCASASQLMNDLSVNSSLVRPSSRAASALSASSRRYARYLSSSFFVNSMGL